MKKIPYGIGNFEKIITENRYFVDKTKFIEEIENLNSDFLFFMRPRRFGKSLFLSMLEYLDLVIPSVLLTPNIHIKIFCF